MITVITDTAAHQIDAKPEHVTQTGPVLKIVNTKGQVIATFRHWNSWLETPTTEGQA